MSEATDVIYGWALDSWGLEADSPGSDVHPARIELLEKRLRESGLAVVPIGSVSPWMQEFCEIGDLDGPNTSYDTEPLYRLSPTEGADS